MATTTAPPESLAERVSGAAMGTTGLRVGLVAAQAAMVVQTWRLWQVRSVPPNLPVWSWLPEVDTGVLLLLTLVVVLVRPRIGIPLHVGVLVAALALDQMRLQPEFVSVAILLVAAGPWPLAPTLGRAHLASLWLWAGFAKLTSAGFATGIVPTVAANVGLSAHPGLVLWGVPLLEVGLGVAAIVPVTRRWAGLAAFAFHVSAVVALDMQLWWAILPWNLALAWAALHLFFLQPRPAEASGGPSAWLAAATADRRRLALLVVVFAYPALVYVGLLDLYLGHHVYAGDGPAAVVCTADGRCSSFGPDVSGAAVRAIIPPERRVLEQWFLAQCRPGEVLRLTGRSFKAPLDHTALTAPSALACPAA